jgi:hypothetical protein
VRIARDPALFTYLAKCPSPTAVVEGDARLEIARAPDGAYDLIVLDAFSSDAIDRKSTRLNSSHLRLSRMPSSA